MFKTILRNSLIGIIITYLLGSFVVYHVECWNQRNRQFEGTIVGINNSMGKYSSTCLMEVNWDGIGEQVINGGSMGCAGYTEGSRIVVSRGWNFLTGKNGTAYIPYDPKLLSDNWIITIGAAITEFILLVLVVIGTMYFVNFLFSKD